MKTRLLSFVLVLVLLFGLGISPIQAATPEEIELAIVNGVAWMVAQQQADGAWQDPYVESPIAITGFAVAKLADLAMEQGYESPFDEAYPYHENVISGLDYLFLQIAPSACGSGFVYGGGYHETYSAGIAMMAVAASRDPSRMVGTIGSAVDGMTYLEVLQGNVDYFECAQNPDGGWRYFWTDESSDNSNTGYATLGLRYAEAFGAVIPQTLKDNLSLFLDAIQTHDPGNPNYGGSQYTIGGGWENLLKTGNLLFELAFVGDGVTDQRVMDAIAYIERHWNDANSDPGWRNPFHYQSMYCMMKGFEALVIDEITVDGNPVDWFAEFVDAILTTQQTDGSWAGDYWGGPVVATEWALMTLEKVSPPPPTIDVPVDIKPTSCRNPLNVKDQGLLPVAILGTETFDVTQVDPASILLVGIAPVGFAYEDVATPFEPFIGKVGAFDCTTAGPDGFIDLTLKFETQAILTALGPVADGDVLVLPLTGSLLPEFGSVPIVGEDVVVILNKVK